jgi:hypothetical protein
MNLDIQKLQKNTLFVLTFILISLWNIPHTIAGRYACEALLLIIIIACKPNWGIFYKANKYLVAFTLYILIHWLFFSTNHRIAFDNFRAEWMHFILFSVIGGGLGLIIGKNYNVRYMLVYLGVAFSIPLFIHLFLFFLKIYEQKVLFSGFVGISETHGPLAYASLQASILFFTYLIYQTRNNLEKALIGLLILICLISPLVASSRGGIGFVILTLIFIYTLHCFLKPGPSITPQKKVIGIISVLLISLVTYLSAAKLDPQRWNGGISRIADGLRENPINVFCTGKSFTSNNLEKNSIDLDKDQSVGIELAFDGDVSRVLVGRAGIILAAKNPLGFDGSKNGYQLAIFSECGKVPALTISNAHNGWIDTSLALGIPGALLLLIVFLRYAKVGWTEGHNDSEVTPFAIALFASTSLWLLRGLVDSTLRDQMLEIQAFIFALLLGLIVAKVHENKLTK